MFKCSQTSCEDLYGNCGPLLSLASSKMVAPEPRNLILIAPPSKIFASQTLATVLHDVQAHGAVSSFLSAMSVDMDALKTLEQQLRDSQEILRNMRVQYAESALAYSLYNLRKDSPDKSPVVMKQIIVEHLSKLSLKLPAPSKEGDPQAGEALIHPTLLSEAKKNMS